MWTRAVALRAEAQKRPRIPRSTIWCDNYRTLYGVAQILTALATVRRPRKTYLFSYYTFVFIMDIISHNPLS